MKKIIPCLCLVVLGDLFFYGHPVGWTAGAYLAILSCLVAFQRGRFPRGKPAILLLLAILGLALALIENPGPLPAALGALGVISLSMVVRGQWTSSVSLWVHRWTRYLLSGWIRPLRDLQTLLRWSSRNSGLTSLSFRPGVVGKWVVPVLLSLVFVALFAVANPVIERWLMELKSHLGRGWDSIFQFLEIWRLLFWLLLGIWIWSLIRIRVPSPPPRLPAEEIPDRFSASSIVRCLFLFNLVFLLETGLDVKYLWAGSSLPEGMSYAGYAHRGAYPLILTVLLAAVFVLVTFRPGGRSEKSPWARRLVYFWIVQNVLLTISSVWRLSLYIEAYNLTRWRVAALLWFILVALGLVWICLRIILARSNSWLLRVNVLCALILLYAASLANFDGWIAWYNVKNCRETGGRGVEIDLDYLHALGEEALPAVSWLKNRMQDPARRDELTAMEEDLREDLDRSIADWRGWTFLRHRLRAGLLRGEKGASGRREG